ncbi:hypothetical protein BH11MYX3_BH11MYX3_25460 [soil metagenome]
MALLAGCANRSPYTCSSSDQCVLGGETGFCEPEGFCSFPDLGCEGGRRFEPNAGNGLGGTCAAPPDAPAPPCGGTGQACCEGEPGTCTDGNFCQGGTCQQCVTDVAIGHRYICQLKYDHTIWCSGTNGSGELGTGMSSMMPVATPVQVVEAGTPMTDVTHLRGGYEFTCAVRTNGNVWCWGRGNQGQLGNGAAMPIDSITPVRVVKQNGEPLSNIVQIDSGYSHTCARDTNGDVWCWGRNSSAELGDGTVLPQARNFASRVLQTAGGTPFTGATELISGGDHNCVIKAGDQVWCWGADYNGQLGDNQTMLHMVPFMAGRSTSIATGIYHLCMLNADSSMSCSGANYHGSIGNGLGGSFNGADEKVPVKVLSSIGGPPLMGVAKVVLGGPMSCALMQDKTVQCWGDSNNGQTGAGTGAAIPSPVLRKTDDGARKLADVDRLLARFPRACAHTTEGTWLCWGRGRDGEFGDGKRINRGIAEPLTGVTCP